MIQTYPLTKEGVKKSDIILATGTTRSLPIEGITSWSKFCKRGILHESRAILLIVCVSRRLTPPECARVCVCVCVVKVSQPELGWNSEGIVGVAQSSRRIPKKCVLCRYVVVLCVCDKWHLCRWGGASRGRESVPLYGHNKQLPFGQGIQLPLAHWYETLSLSLSKMVTCVS